ncbi:choline transporter-like protein 2 isoform X1 [Biomphalaria glabrata]|uniref:Choline transporter-like protein n=2 Tax=Biomphalaria glabrata TaxID=6526 RepID=A0A9W3BBF7_BIOGL|nr:choline transporter-like protein 2 isoform X1 [Biomphalaria glabrata]XP_055896842.1 choline transporter-like protein 2 isoform X1 [Biomphalaria glabrata]
MPCCGGSENISSADDVKKYGEARPFDPNFKGPIKKRSCTDVVCCILFVIFLAGMIAVSLVGYVRGDPVKLIYPTDSSGNICGVDTYKEKKYLFMFDILKCAETGLAVVSLACPTTRICVKTCPSEYWSFIQTVALETAVNKVLASEREKMICKYNVDPQSAAKTVQKYVKDGDCAAYYVKTTSVMNYCVPSIFVDIVNLAADITYQYNNKSYAITDSGNSSVTGRKLSDASYYLSLFYQVKEFVDLVFKDILASWWMILVGCFVSLLLCMLWMFLLRWLAGIMVWATLVCIYGLLSFACYYCYNEYYRLKALNATEEYGISQAFAMNFNYYLSLKKTWLAFGCATSTLLILLLFLFLFLVKRVCIAIELIKEASRAIGYMFSTLFWPLVPFLLQVIFLVYWVASVIYIASMGHSQYYSNATNTSTNNINYYLSRVPCQPDNSTLGTLCEFVKYGGNEYVIPMEVFMVFMLLWTLNFIVALSHMTLAGSFGSYYWSWEKPKDIPAFPVAMSLFRSFRYHLGSLAFGSLIIAIIQLIRIFLEYLDYKLKDSQNKVAKFILICLKCCFWCLEKFMKFINKNAYILIAIRGKNFCISAKDAFFLIMRNSLRVIVLDKVTDFLLFLSRVLVTGAVFTMSFFWFKGSINFFDNYVVRPNLNYYLAPVIIQTVSTYLMTCVFFGVYNMAVDTLFLCFLEDLEMNDGTAEKPYFMSKGLMKILGKRNVGNSPSSRPAHTARVTPERRGRPLPQPRAQSRA